MPGQYLQKSVVRARVPIRTSCGCDPAAFESDGGHAVRRAVLAGETAPLLLTVPVTVDEPQPVHRGASFVPTFIQDQISSVRPPRSSGRPVRSC